MSAVTFDTLEFVKELEAAGVPSKQAEAQARALTHVLKDGTGELATKNDIIDLKREMSELEVRMYKAMLMQTFALAAFIGALKLFGH